MTPIESPNPLRKASWKRWVIAAACVAAIALAVLFLKSSAPEKVSVRFVESFSENGQKKLLFEGTNRLAKAIFYTALVQQTKPKTNLMSALSYRSGLITGGSAPGGQ